jgi:predicted alpha-1,2-mannosidase
MVKSADQLKDNPLRPGLEDYLKYGYLTTTTTNSGSVSTTQEYNISDYAIAQLAKALGKKEDYQRFSKRSKSYRKLLDKNLNLLRPRNEDGSWVTPYDPTDGANFIKNVGFIEGNAWQYTFMAPHDIPGLMKLMGGKKKFSQQLAKVFNSGQFDMANEPDIMYPYLFNYVSGDEYKTQDKVKELLEKYYKNKPEGLPGNDDTGTMSAWAVFSMMGIYPINPANPVYAITTPSFDKITIHLNQKYYEEDKIEISKVGKGKISKLQSGSKTLTEFFVSHENLVNNKSLKIELTHQ